jgi:hypothetical protein
VEKIAAKTKNKEITLNIKSNPLIRGSIQEKQTENSKVNVKK